MKNNTQNLKLPKCSQHSLWTKDGTVEQKLGIFSYEAFCNPAIIKLHVILQYIRDSFPTDELTEVKTRQWNEHTRKKKAEVDPYSIGFNINKVRKAGQ